MSIQLFMKKILLFFGILGCMVISLLILSPAASAATSCPVDQKSFNQAIGSSVSFTKIANFIGTICSKRIPAMTKVLQVSAPSSIPFTFENTTSFSAGALEGGIIMSRMFVIEHLADEEMEAVLIHEMSHVLQEYKNAPAWATEGIANYVVLKIFPEHKQDLGPCSSNTPIESAGYGCWAKFINNAERNSSCPTSLVVKMTACYRGGVCNVFPSCGLVSVDDAWRKFGPRSGFASVTPKPTIVPTKVPTKAPTVTIVPKVTILPSKGQDSPSKFSVEILLHGIGNSGDNPNPTLHTFSNKNPKIQTRNATVSIIDSHKVLVAKASGEVAYDSKAGSFKGVIPLGSEIQKGTYTIKVESPNHLPKTAISILAVTNGNTYSLPATHLVAGDLDEDNKLDILDYIIFLDCFGDAATTNCTDDKRMKVDLNDDGVVNSVDYNLFIRELSVLGGD